MKDACSLPGCAALPRPSMVRTLRPSQAATGVMQAKMGWSSSSTVQAPHCPMPQPNLAPFSSSWLRSAYSSGVDGSMSTAWRTPLTIRVLIVGFPFVSR
jgi:hypothetical protein